DREPTAAFPPDLLRETVDQVAFAAATDDTRPVLAGVLMRLKGTTATFAAADGFRLAVRTVELPEPVAEPQEVIVPARALLELARIIGDVEGSVEVTVTPSGGQIPVNVEFLAEALNAIKTPQIALETQTPQNPGVFKPVGADGYIHIVMPMTVR